MSVDDWDNILKVFQKIQHDIAAGLHLGLDDHWRFLTGDLKDRVIFDIVDPVSRWLGRHPKGLMKIQHDVTLSLTGMSETNFRVVETETRTEYVFSIYDDGVDDEI